MRKGIYILGCVVALLACHQGSKSKKQLSKDNNAGNYQRNTQERIKDTNTVQQVSNATLDSINVVSLKEDYSKGAIQLYNHDGSIWKTFEVADNFSDNEIASYAVKPENRIMVFRVVGRKNNFYLIVVNEEKNIIKCIKPKSPYFNYETWQQHIVKAFSVDFLPKKNPLKEMPYTTAKTLPFDKEQFYHPKEIIGNWLKVKDDDNKEGWIKWRNEDGELSITIYYED